MPTTRVEEKGRQPKFLTKINIDLGTGRITGYTGGRLPRQDFRRYPNRRGYPLWVEIATTGTPPAAPVLTTLTPNTVVAGAPTLVTVAGTGFVAGCVVRVNGIDQATTFVSATSLTFTADEDTTGAQQVTVRRVAAVSNALTLTVTTVMADREVSNPEEFTIAQLQTFVDAHPELADEVLSAEQARSSPRVTLVEWLEGFISHRDEGHIP